MRGNVTENEMSSALVPDQDNTQILLQAAKVSRSKMMKSIVSRVDNISPEDIRLD